MSICQMGYTTERTQSTVVSLKHELWVSSEEANGAAQAQGVVIVALCIALCVRSFVLHSVSSAKLQFKTGTVSALYRAA